MRRFVYNIIATIIALLVSDFAFGSITINGGTMSGTLKLTDNT